MPVALRALYELQCPMRRNFSNTLDWNRWMLWEEAKLSHDVKLILLHNH